MTIQPRKQRDNRGRQLDRLLRLAQQGDLDAFLAELRVIDSKLEADDDGAGRHPDWWLAENHPDSGDTVAIVASRSDSVRLLDHLLARGADFASQSNFDAKRALHEAAQAGALASADWLLRVARVPVDPLKRADWTPLMLASAKPFEPMIRLLLSHGACAQLVNKDGWTPLHLACRVGQPACVRLLLDADPGQAGRPARNGRTPAHTLALHGHAGLLADLLGGQPRLANQPDSCGCTPAMEACKAGSLACLQAVLDADARQNDGNDDGGGGGGRVLAACDSAGFTCLHHAAACGRIEICRFLLERLVNADWTGATRDRVTPLQLACREGQPEVVRLLLLPRSHGGGGADPGRLDARGRSAEDYANRLVNEAGSLFDQCRALVAEARLRLAAPSA